MSEEKADAILETIDIIATARALERFWLTAGKRDNAAIFAGDVAKAKKTLKQILMKEDESL